jgi:DNA-binding response OmpR family regulator
MLHPATILLAEDDQSLRQLMRAALERAGHTVLEARDGEHALEIANRLGDAVDLLLADVVMPRMGGCVLANRLLARYPLTKVLYVTGRADVRSVLEGNGNPTSAVLRKPFTPRDLTRRVREVLEG